MDLGPVKAAASEAAAKFSAEHPSSGPRNASEVLIHAWYEEVQREWRERFSATDALRQEMERARNAAGRYPDDVVAANSAPAMVATVGERKIVASGCMVAGCVPLWVHYVSLNRQKIAEDSVRPIDALMAIPRI